MDGKRELITGWDLARMRTFTYFASTHKKNVIKRRNSTFPTGTFTL